MKHPRPRLSQPQPWGGLSAAAWWPRVSAGAAGSGGGGAGTRGAEAKLQLAGRRAVRATPRVRAQHTPGARRPGHQHRPLRRLPPWGEAPAQSQVAGSLPARLSVALGGGQPIGQGSCWAGPAARGTQVARADGSGLVRRSFANSWGRAWVQGEGTCRRHLEAFPRTGWGEAWPGLSTPQHLPAAGERSRCPVPRLLGLPLHPGEGHRHMVLRAYTSCGTLSLSFMLFYILLYF